MLAILNNIIVLLTALQRLLPDDTVLYNLVGMIIVQLDTAIDEATLDEEAAERDHSDILYQSERLATQEHTIACLRDDLSFTRDRMAFLERDFDRIDEERRNLLRVIDEDLPEFDAQLCFNSPITHKINLIKILREHTGLWLKDAKDTIDSCIDNLGTFQPIISNAESYTSLAMQKLCNDMRVQEPDANIQVKVTAVLP